MWAVPYYLFVKIMLPLQKWLLFIFLNIVASSKRVVASSKRDRVRVNP